jgi:hypothetical protein
VEVVSSQYQREDLPCYICIADDEAIKVDDAFTSTRASSVMDIDPTSTQASSEMDTNQFISISDDNDDNNDAKEEKIIKEAEKKISM